MADETPVVAAPRPGQVAQNEIAKQAVALIFGLITAAVLMRMQKKMAREMGQATRDALGPGDVARTERMRAAKRTEHVWLVAAGFAARLSGRVLAAADWAAGMAEKARAGYEADRA
jgi:hypothetical protein